MSTLPSPTPEDHSDDLKEIVDLLRTFTPQQLDDFLVALPELVFQQQQREWSAYTPTDEDLAIMESLESGETTPEEEAQIQELLNSLISETDTSIMVSSAVEGLTELSDVETALTALLTRLQDLRKQGYRIIAPVSEGLLQLEPINVADDDLLGIDLPSAPPVFFPATTHRFISYGSLSAVLLGSDSTYQIVLSHLSGQVLAVSPEKLAAPKFVNSSLNSFQRSLDVWNELYTHISSGEQASSRLYTSLDRIDPASLTAGTWWLTKLNTLRGN